MNRGEPLTKATIWLTLAGYAAGVFIFRLSRGRYRWDRIARISWTVACIALIAHVASAFHFYHSWSHGQAHDDTARQTAAVFGLEWGGGLYVNYALIAAWLADVAWWWYSLERYRLRPASLVAAWQGFLLFVFFNATVVFETGAVRLIGLVLTLSICSVWWLTRRQEKRSPVS
jgi:hypothetical protein